MKRCADNTRYTVKTDRGVMTLESPLVHDGHELTTEGLFHVNPKCC